MNRRRVFGRQAKYNDLYTVYYGPYGTSFKCALCHHYEFARKGEGRGKGAKARGRLIQHIKKEHREAL